MAIYCCPMADHDPLEDARARTRQALNSDFWPAIKIATLALVTLPPTTAGAALGLLSQDFITRPTTLWLIALAVLAAPALVFLAVELRRIYERAAALRGLYEAQRQYEILLGDARRERDRLAESNTRLMHENAALNVVLQTFVGMTARTAAEKETRD